MTKIETTGSGSFEEFEGGWSVSEFATPVVVSDSGSQIGDITASVIRDADTDLLEGDGITLTNDALGTTSGRIHTVAMTSPSTASLSADSALYRFLSGRMRLPGIESGLPAAALDMVMQASGTKRQTGVNAGDDYWSLAGHSVGFDANGQIIEPTSTVHTWRNTGVLVHAGATDGELVQHEETTGFCAIDDLTSDGFPRKVYVDTIPTRAPVISYLKFTVRPTATDTTTEYLVDFGPSTRNFPGFGNYTNNTRITVTLSTTAAGGTLAGAIRYQEAGSTVSVSDGATSSQAFLSRDREITVTMTAFFVLGYLGLKFSAASSAGTTSVYEMLEMPAGAGSTLYSYHPSISQTSGGYGIKDLVTRRGDNNTDQFPTFAGLGYATDHPLLNELATSHGGSPIAGFDGEMWDYLRQIASARGVEIAAIPEGITLREPGIRTLDLTRRASAARKISSAVAARNVTIVNHNTAVLTGTAAEAWRATSIYSVDVGETKTFTTAIPDGVRFLWSPRPWIYSIAVNAVQMFTYADQYAALEADKLSLYYVTASDGYPVPPTLWLEYGGGVRVRVVDGKAEITLTGPTKEIPGITGPFKIGESATSSDYAVLRVKGVGVTANPIEVSLPSGAAHGRTRVESSSTVTNVAIGSIVELYDAAAWVAQRTAGPQVTLNAVMPADSADTFGYLTGALATFEGNVFRIDSARASSGTVTLDATKLTTLGDTPDPGRTLDEFVAALAGKTCHDYSIKPLTF